MIGICLKIQNKAIKENICVKILVHDNFFRLAAPRVNRSKKCIKFQVCIIFRLVSRSGKDTHSHKQICKQI